MKIILRDKTENQVKNYEFIKIYKISYVKIFIYYISEIYSSKELYNQFNDRINFIDLIKNTNNNDSFEIYFIKCLKFFNDNSFSNFVFNHDFDYFKYFGLKHIKIKYFEKEKTNEYFYHPLEVIYINDLPSYLKLKELYNNNLEEDIVKKMIGVKGEMFFFDFIFNDLLCFFFNKNFSNEYLKNDYYKNLSKFFTSISNEKIKKILESIFYLKETQYEFKFTDKETTLLSYCFNFYILSLSDSNIDPKSFLNLVDRNKKKLYSLTFEFLGLIKILNKNFIEKKYDYCIKLMKIIVNIANKIEKNLNIFYDKSDIFTFLNYIKKFIILNEPIERIIFPLINNLNNETFKNEYKNNISNYLKFTKLNNNSIRIIVNNITEKDGDNNLNDFLFFQKFYKLIDIEKDILQKNDSIISFYIENNSNIEKINNIVNNINPIINKIYELYNGKISRKKLSEISMEKFQGKNYQKFQLNNF